MGVEGGNRLTSARKTRGCGAAGSAPAWHAGGQGFESPQLHFFFAERRLRSLPAAASLISRRDMCFFQQRRELLVVKNTAASAGARERVPCAPIKECISARLMHGDGRADVER